MLSAHYHLVGLGSGARSIGNQPTHRSREARSVCDRLRRSSDTPSIDSSRLGGYPELTAAGCTRVALTGGPGGGKTTVMRELHAEDPSAHRWRLVPEAAPALFAARLDARHQRFQKAVVRLQMELEERCAATAGPGQQLLCHRGTLDPLAYWLFNGWSEEEFFLFTETSLDEHLNRYDAVIHVQTAAIGAPEHYRRWPDAHRGESLEEAAELDHLCARAWSGHPCRWCVRNDGCDWPSKARAIRQVLDLLRES
jgi:predicted ATPase